MPANANLACYPPQVVRVCKLSGAEAKLLEARVVTLKDSERFLEQVVRDAESAVNAYEIFAALEIGARAVLMVCDILIVGLESVTGGAGMAIAKLYDGSKLAVDAAFGGEIDQKTAYLMLAKNKVKITELTLKELGGKAGKYAEAIEKIEELFGMAEAMWGFFSGARSQQADGSAGIRSAAQTAKAQLRKIQRQISAIEDKLRNCEPDDALGALLLP